MYGARDGTLRLYVCDASDDGSGLGACDKVWQKKGEQITEPGWQHATAITVGRRGHVTHACKPEWQHATAITVGRQARAHACMHAGVT